MSLDFSSRVAARKVGGQGAQGLKFGKAAVIPVIRKPCQGGVEFVDDVGEIPARVEG